MTRITRTLLSAAAFVALSLNIAHAQAGPATISFTDPNCVNWGMSQSGSTFTLTCQTLTCSISADIPAPLPTQGVSLIATCVGSTGSTTWAWTKFAGPGTCPAPSPTNIPGPVALVAPGSQQLGCVYKVAANDAANGGGSATITLNWTNTPAQSPTGCSVAFTVGSANMPSTGGNVTMVGSCTGNVNANTTYAWTKSGSAFVSGATATDTLPQNTGASTVGWTYVFQATNAGAATTNTTQVVNVAGTGGGGGSFDLSGCTSQGYTGRGLDITFPTGVNTSVPNGAANASPAGTFGNNDALVIRFTTPAAGVNDQSVFQPAGNVPYQNTSRIYTVSTQPCQVATSSTATGTILYAAAGQSPAITINNKTCPYPAAVCPVYGAWLTPNTTYYITMVNKTGFGGSGSCAGSSCDMRIDFNN